jgi:malate synthase
MPRANGRNANGHPSLVDEGIVVAKPAREAHAPVLGADALRFVADLTRRFRATRDELLKLRAIRQREIDAGLLPDFLPDTVETRTTDWTVAPVPKDLLERPARIGAPSDREALAQTLGSGVGTYVADFEDSSSPTWFNCVEGHAVLRAAIRDESLYTGNDLKSRLRGHPPTLFARPRGWQLDERHLRVDDEPVPAALFDFGLYFFHNAAELLKRGTRPYFCLPKIESHLEARLWNDAFNHAQDALGIPHGSIRAIVFIETVLAAFEMDEILHELRDHCAGLSCDCWDYVFSFIKRFRNRPDFVLPDRALLMTGPRFLCAYVDQLVLTCRRRGALAVPFDGNCASRIVDRHVEADVDPIDLLTVPEGDITEGGLRENVRVGLTYLESWLGGAGSVVVGIESEDTAGAEVARAQLWQWVRHKVQLDDGRAVTVSLVREMIALELASVQEIMGPERFAESRFDLASKLLAEMTTRDEFTKFLTQAAYGYLE